MKNTLAKKTIKNIQDLIASLQVSVNEAGKIVVDREGEKAIAWVLQLEKKIQEVKEKIAERVLQEGKKQMEGFSGMQGKYLKIYRRRYFKVKDEERAKSFVKEVVRTYKNADKQKIEEYFLKTGELPEGIDIEEKLVIALKNNE